MTTGIQATDNEAEHNRGRVALLHNKDMLIVTRESCPPPMARSAAPYGLELSREFLTEAEGISEVEGCLVLDAPRGRTGTMSAILSRVGGSRFWAAWDCNTRHLGDYLPLSNEMDPLDVVASYIWIVAHQCSAKGYTPALIYARASPDPWGSVGLIDATDDLLIGIEMLSERVPGARFHSVFLGCTDQQRLTLIEASALAGLSAFDAKNVGQMQSSPFR